MKALLILLLLTGCKVSRSASFEYPAVANVPVVDPEQPILRILDDGRGLRMIVQDPITKYYVLVR